MPEQIANSAQLNIEPNNNMNYQDNPKKKPYSEVEKERSNSGVSSARKRLKLEPNESNGKTSDNPEDKAYYLELEEKERSNSGAFSVPLGEEIQGE